MVATSGGPPIDSYSYALGYRAAESNLAEDAEQGKGEPAALAYEWLAEQWHDKAMRYLAAGLDSNPLVVWAKARAALEVSELLSTAAAEAR